MPKSKELVSTKSTDHIVVNSYPSEQFEVENCIFTIRGVQVMLDSDLAKFYGIETKRINEQVKRNPDRFPEDFVFQLTKEEVEFSRSQNATLNPSENGDIVCSRSQNAPLITKRGQNIKYLPYVFTEEGVAQLSGVLRSPIAAQMSVKISRAFVAMRRFIAANAGIFQRLEMVEHKQLTTETWQTNMEHRFDELLNRLDDGSVKPIEGVFVEGQVLDARIYVEQLIGSAKKEVILIDGYIDARTFDILEARKKGVKATIYTESVGRKLLAEAQAHDAEYPGRSIELKAYNNRFHDRFLIVDDDLYHFGASFNELGKRLFAFDKMGLDKNLILGQL